MDKTGRTLSSLHNRNSLISQSSLSTHHQVVLMDWCKRDLQHWVFLSFYTFKPLIPALIHFLLQCLIIGAACPTYRPPVSVPLLSSTTAVKDDFNLGTHRHAVEAATSSDNEQLAVQHGRRLQDDHSLRSDVASPAHVPASHDLVVVALDYLLRAKSRLFKCLLSDNLYLSWPWLPICRQFQMHSLRWKYLYSN